MIFSRKFWGKAKNDAGERIASLRFSVPALRVGVLEYGAGQLQTNNAELDGKVVKLYYPPEAVSDEKFLKSLETAPVVVGGHDSTTNEQNKKIDGWAHTASYDDSQKAAIIDGVVKGAKECAYVKGNLGDSTFGASAFVDIYNLKVESGVTPEGESYNAVALDLRATHVALAPNVRDPKNKIKVNNAVVVNSHGEIKNSEDNSMDLKELSAVVKNAVDEALSAKNEGDRMDALESTVKKHGEVLNEINEKLNPKEETAEKAENSEGEDEKKEEKDGATIENAKPSQAVVAAFAAAYNVDFGAKTPSFSTLAALAGIKESDASARIGAVNTKFAEITASVKNTTSTQQPVVSGDVGEVF